MQPNFWYFLTNCISNMSQPNLMYKKGFKRPFFEELEREIHFDSQWFLYWYTG